jgi:hypothetical protein
MKSVLNLLLQLLSFLLISVRTFELVLEGTVIEVDFIVQGVHDITLANSEFSIRLK